MFFIFLVVMGWFFSQILNWLRDARRCSSAMNPSMGRDLNVTESVMRPLFGNISVVLVLALVPFLTMRLLAEERQTGTIELLLTYPVRDWEVLLGKYLAVFGLYAVLLVLTLLYPLMLGLFRARRVGHGAQRLPRPPADGLVVPGASGCSPRR